MSPLEESSQTEVFHREKEKETSDLKMDEELQEEESFEELAVSSSLDNNDNDSSASDSDSGSYGKAHDGNNAMQQQSPSFDEVSTNHEVLSPAPVVEKGGDNEFVKVSHLASVQVKTVPIQGMVTNKYQKQKAANTRMKLPKMSDSTGTRGSLRNTRKNINNHSTDNTGDSFDEDELYMDIIEISPYEPEGCAEFGEALFQEMRDMLLEDSETSPRTIQIFGQGNAECLKKACTLVEKSGMLYSQNWTKGTIHGNPVGIIPNHLLLLVLAPTRFVKANPLLLSGMCRDLKVCKSVNEALDLWGWSEKYKLVRETEKNYKFKTNKRNCFKCAVFVARAHTCFVIFGKRKLESVMMDKLTKCLDIMEYHLAEAATSSHYGQISAAAGTHTTAAATNRKKRKMPIPDGVGSTHTTASGSNSSSGTKSKGAHRFNHRRQYSHDTSVGKRKRGKSSNDLDHVLMNERKLRSSSRVTQVEPNPSYRQPKNEKKGARSDEDNKFRSASSRQNRHSQPDKTKGATNITDGTDSVVSQAPQKVSGGSAPSIQELISRFEKQHSEMGQQYAEMGLLLAQMKTALAENRQQTEQEIRRELLDEVQMSILRSLPKK